MFASHAKLFTVMTGGMLDCNHNHHIGEVEVCACFPVQSSKNFWPKLTLLVCKEKCDKPSSATHHAGARNDRLYASRCEVYVCSIDEQQERCRSRAVGSCNATTRDRIDASYTAIHREWSKICYPSPPKPLPLPVNAIGRFALSDPSQIKCICKMDSGCRELL